MMENTVKVVNNIPLEEYEELKARSEAYGKQITRIKWKNDYGRNFHEIYTNEDSVKQIIEIFNEQLDILISKIHTENEKRYKIEAELEELKNTMKEKGFKRWKRLF